MIKLALAIVSLWILMALFAFGLGDGANAVNLDQLLRPPHASQWLGHDELGRAVWQRLLLASQTSLFVAVGVVSLSALIGISLGLLSGYLGGWFDRVMVKVIDVFLAFPGLLLAIGLAAVLGPGIENVIIALVVVGWVGYARLARAQVLSLRHREHILAARALNESGYLPARIPISVLRSKVGEARIQGQHLARGEQARLERFTDIERGIEAVRVQGAGPRTGRTDGAGRGRGMAGGAGESRPYMERQFRTSREDLRPPDPRRVMMREPGTPGPRSEQTGARHRALTVPETDYPAVSASQLENFRLFGLGEQSAMAERAQRGR